MLKIKDNVDLNELKKYGLRLEYECNRNTGKVWVIRICKFDKNKYTYLVRFEKHERKNKYNLLYVDKSCYSILYDLIKDGIVEKE